MMTMYTLSGIGGCNKIMKIYGAKSISFGDSPLWSSFRWYIRMTYHSERIYTRIPKSLNAWVEINMPDELLREIYASSTVLWMRGT